MCNVGQLLYTTVQPLTATFSKEKSPGKEPGHEKINKQRTD